MNFPIFMLVVWIVAIAAWFAVSKYFKNSGMVQMKERLMGVGKAKVRKEKKGQPASLFRGPETAKNKLAQLLVDKYRLGPKIQELLEQAGMAWTPARLVNLCLTAAFATFAVGWLMLPIPHIFTLVLAPVAGAVPIVFVFYKRKGRLKKFEELFPEALEFISRSMRAGHAFGVSLEMIHREFQEPLSSEFKRTFEEHNLGLPIEVALQKLGKRVPSLDVHFFVSAVLLQKRTGGNLAEILDKLAYVIRERFKLRGRIRAVSAHGKMTATALSCIPIAVAVLMFYTNPDYVKFFFNDDVGNIMLGSAVTLQIIGYGIMRKIVNIEV
jgi:tight adherence protein B